MIWISGERFRAVWPVAIVTGAEVTLPRSWDGLRPEAAAAFLIAASERMISLTVFGFVCRLCSWPPPDGVNGWPM